MIAALTLVTTMICCDSSLAFHLFSLLNPGIFFSGSKHAVDKSWQGGLCNKPYISKYCICMHLTSEEATRSLAVLHNQKATSCELDTVLAHWKGLGPNMSARLLIWKAASAHCHWIQGSLDIWFKGSCCRTTCRLKKKKKKWSDKSSQMDFSLRAVSDKIWGCEVNKHSKK